MRPLSYLLVFVVAAMVGCGLEQQGTMVEAFVIPHRSHLQLSHTVPPFRTAFADLLTTSTVEPLRRPTTVDTLDDLEQIQEEAAATGLVLANSVSILEQRRSSLLRSKTMAEAARPASTESGPKQRYRSLKDMVNNSTSLEGGDLMCRVVAHSDGKLPNSANKLPASLFQAPHILRRLDDIYHAQAHDETRILNYMQRRETVSTEYDEKEEKELVTAVRTSLEDAGFSLLSRRDLDLCEALNAGYLLRLSILPDASGQDPNIAREFYPGYFDASGNIIDEKALAEKILFDGRVLVFWRGYSQEVTHGRLLLPKLDYLQASLVQRLSGNVKRYLDRLERSASTSVLRTYRRATACYLWYLRQLADSLPNRKIGKAMRKRVRSPFFYSSYKALNNGELPRVDEIRAAGKDTKRFKLARYGGSKIRFVGSPNPMDAMNPFVICEEGSGSCEGGCDRSPKKLMDEAMYESLNNKVVSCPYDSKHEGGFRPVELLERVSISNLVDVFSREGRQSLFKTIVSKSELVEPTYEEVVVVWRPLPRQESIPNVSKIKPPKIAYELADMFDIKGLPEIPKEQPSPRPSPLEIRTFEKVPMANLPAVLPKTKLVFRPADAFKFDLVSIVGLLAILSSLKFDNPKLDLLALASISLWMIRTIIRYSNKLARYDLLVKTFLTSKISHRNAGALKYLATQAGSQRATRASLVFSWLNKKLTRRDEPLNRSALKATGSLEVNELIKDVKQVPVNIDAALHDLEDLGLVRKIDKSGEHLEVVRDKQETIRTLKRVWASLFDGKTSLKRFLDRRRA